MKSKLWLCLVSISLLVLVSQTSVLKSASPLLYTHGALTTYTPQPIYSTRRKDAWNQIFFLLFTRKIKMRVSSSLLPKGQPLIKWPDADLRFPKMVSKRLFERIESGEQTIVPFPLGRRRCGGFGTFHPCGVVTHLDAPLYQRLKRTLETLLQEKKQRSLLHRALMQHDLWGAFDELYYRRAPKHTAVHQKRKVVLLRLLAKAIKKLALTTKQIRSLRPNVAFRASHMPGVFGFGKGWLELRLPKPRTHDRLHGFRMATRLFYLPRKRYPSAGHFAKAMLKTYQKHIYLKSSGLVLQALLLNRQGQVIPSPLTYAIEIREFVRDKKGKVLRFVSRVQHLSRQKLLRAPTSSGMYKVGENHPVFQSNAGRDLYGLAPIQSSLEPPTALLVTVKERCAFCHGKLGRSFNSLGHGLRRNGKIEALSIHKHQYAKHVARVKGKRKEYRQLLRYLQSKN